MKTTVAWDMNGLAGIAVEPSRSCSVNLKVFEFTNSSNFDESKSSQIFV